MQRSTAPYRGRHSQSADVGELIAVLVGILSSLALHMNGLAVLRFPLFRDFLLRTGEERDDVENLFVIVRVREIVASGGAELNWIRVP